LRRCHLAPTDKKKLPARLLKFGVAGSVAFFIVYDGLAPLNQEYESALSANVTDKATASKGR